MAKAKEEKKEEFDLTKIKEEIKDYVDLQVKKGIRDELDKTYNKIIRQKKRRIFFKNLLILILLCIIGFLIYLLNENRYFENYLTHNQNTINNETNVNKDVNKDVNKERSLNELKKEYAYLLDNIYINESSIYLKDYYNGNLTSELKNYLSFNLVDLNKLSIDNDSLVIDCDTLNVSYAKLFNDNIENITFNYNGSKINYFKALKIYLTNKDIKKDNSNIKREITSIKVDNNLIKISTVEGLIKDNKLFNVLTNEEIKKYHNDSLINYQDKLNKITYTFKNKKLESIK